MADDTIHTCSYECERPGCIRAQRDELAARLEALTAAPQRPVEDGCHCGTCTCNPNMTPAVRFDLSPTQMEGAIREHLIRLGWTPPEQRAEIEALRAEVERLRADRDSWEQQASDRVADWYAEHLRAERLAEALRELVDVFSKSGMYDDEVFDKARAALGEDSKR